MERHASAPGGTLRRAHDGRAHILFDHLLADVALHGTPDARWAAYVVDSAGILRKAPDERLRRSRLRHPMIASPPLEWLGVRKIGRMGSLLAWFVPTREAERIVVRWSGHRLEYVVPIGTPVGFRQARALDRDERSYFESLEPAVKNAILAASPIADRVAWE